MKKGLKLVAIFTNHTKGKGTISITLEIAKMMEKLSKCVKPGRHICVTCSERFKTDYNCLKNSETSLLLSNSESECLSFHNDPDIAKETLNKTFQSVGIFPIFPAGPPHNLLKRQQILKAKIVSKVAQKSKNLMHY